MSKEDDVLSKDRGWISMLVGVEGNRLAVHLQPEFYPTRDIL
jgi:hypothetical protein